MTKACCDDLQAGDSVRYPVSERSEREPHKNLSANGTESVRPIVPRATEKAKELLSLALATLGWEERMKLMPVEEAVRRHILTQFPLLGRAPRQQEIALALGLNGLSEVQSILQRLHALDLLYLNPANQEVRIAYPFSSLPTHHVVHFLDWAEAKPVYAPCAVDALGIPFMVRRDVSITSSCAHCGKPITIEVRNLAITHHQPTDAAVWAGTTRSNHAATSICPTINFFCSPAHVSAWWQSHPEAVGQLLNLGEALYLGKGIFEPLLQEEPDTSSPATASPRSTFPDQTAMRATSGGGLVAAFLASICCIGPLVFAAMGVGIGATGVLASMAGFLKALLPYRPWFIGLTAALLGTAFYLEYRSPRAACATGTTSAPVSDSRKTRAVLWLVTVAAVALILAPYWLGL